MSPSFSPSEVLLLCGTILISGFGVFVASSRASRRTLRALGLLIVFVGYLFTFAVVASLGRGRPADSGLGAVLLLSAVAIFAILGQFEPQEFDQKEK